MGISTYRFDVLYKEKKVDMKIPFTEFLDLEQRKNMKIIIVVRLILSLSATY